MTNRLQPGTVAILGADALGRRFAAAALRAGYVVILEDFRAEVLERAQAELIPIVTTAASGARLILERTVEDACREADLVIDTTVDDSELKLEIFTLLDKFARPGAACATIAASIAIAELAAITYRPELCVGLRLESDAAAGEILTIVRARRTSEEAVRACEEFARRAGWRSAVEIEAGASDAETGAGR
jgi:3-hydroxybutyryl-CoA dehydrogenase